MLRGLKDTYRKSEAAVYIQNIFELQKEHGRLIADPAKAANRIVNSGWSVAAPLMGKSMRPHKLTLAAFSVAVSLREVPLTSGSFVPLLIALDFLLEGIETNIDLEPFEPIDMTLIRQAVSVYKLKAGSEAKNLPELYRCFT